MTTSTPRKIARFMIQEMGISQPGDYAPEGIVRPPVLGLFDKVIEVNGISQKDAFNRLIARVQEAGFDASPLLAIAGRYTDETPPTVALPAWWTFSHDPAYVWLAVSIGAADTAAPVISALAPYVIYIDEETKVSSYQGRVMFEQVLVPRMAYGDSPAEVSTIEVESLEPMTRLTLYPSIGGTLVNLSNGGPTEEGYSNQSETIREDEDESGAPVWLVETNTDSQDCDGRMSSGWIGFSSGGPRGYVKDAYPTMSDASKATPRESWNRDRQAEEAGY